MRFPATRDTTYKHKGRQSRFSPGLRAILMLLIPLSLFAGPLPHYLMNNHDMAGMTAMAGSPPRIPAAVNLVPPSNLQLLALDTSIHVTWTPSNDPATAFHMISVWEGSALQQSKVVSKTSGAGQANGVEPGHTYTVRVYAM